MTDAAPDRAATTGAPAPRVSPARPAAILLLLLVLAGAIGFQLSRMSTPEQTAAPAAPAPTAPRAEAAAAALDARIASLEARVQADPADARGWQELGLAYQDKALRSGELTLSTKAAESLAKADALMPGDPAIITARGLVTASRHDFAGARALVEPLVAGDPYAADARAVLVDALIELGEYEQAERYLDELGRLRPGQATLSRISYFRELHGDLDGALVAMRRAGTGNTDPWGEATVRTFIADLLLLQGKAEPALAELDKALAAQPELSGAVASRGAALLALGRYDEAVASLEQHLRSNEDVAVASRLADLRGLKGQDTADLDRMIDEVLAEETAAGYDTVLERADIELGRGNLDTARALAEEAYAKRPANIFTAEVLAYVRYTQGDVAGAVALVPQFTRLNSADLHQHVRSAEILHAAGDREAATARLERAFEMAPYPEPSLVEGARTLAAELGIEPPATWRPPV